MYVVVLFLEAKGDCSEKLRGALTAHAASVRANDPGCERFDVVHDPLEPNAFLIYQVFDSEEAFTAHFEQEAHLHFASRIEPWVKTERKLTYTLLDTGHMV